MKKKLLCLGMSLLLLIGCLSACGQKEVEVVNGDPELEKIQAICTLATMECYYHDVAIIEKLKNVDGTFFDFLKKDRHMWIEYTGIVKIGIDVKKVKLEIDGDNVKITIPPAELLSVSKEDFNEDSFYASEDDWLVKNKFSASDQTRAVNETQEVMTQSILANAELMRDAQIKAQKLIANYVNMLGDATGRHYMITWEFEDGTTATEIPDAAGAIPGADE